MNAIEITPEYNAIQYGTSANDTPCFSMLMSEHKPVAYSTSSSFTIVPDSFLKGLADCDEGRVVDMEKAMEEPPSPT